MFGTKNPVLEEKPDHAHYPACRGRLEAIEKNGFRLLIYTLIASFLLAVLSIMGNPIQVVGWIPLLISNSPESLSVGLCFLQALISLSLAVLAFFGCGRRKILHLVLLLIYGAMFISCLVYRYTVLDIFTFIIGGMGILFGYNSYADYFDYKQISETEGFPQFSLILTEYDEKKDEQKKFEEWYSARQQRSHPGSGNDDPATAPVEVPKVPEYNSRYVQSVFKEQAPSAGIGDMPEITVNGNVHGSSNSGRFRQRSGKAEKISDSNMKFR